MTLMQGWKFLCYRNASGKNQITPSLTALSKTGMMQLRRALEHLSVKPQTSWERPHASSAVNHIYVIRFRDENRTQHRLFGHHDLTGSEFVITLYGFEKDGKYEPSNYITISTTRRSECMANPGKHKCSCLQSSDSLFTTFDHKPQQITGLDARSGKSPSVYGRKR